MLFAALTYPNARQIVALLFVIVLLGASCTAWTLLLVRRHYTGKLGLDRSDEPRTDWRMLSELTVVGLTLLLIAMHLLPKLEPPSAEPVVLTTRLLLHHTAFTSGLAAVLFGFLVFSGRSPADYGFKQPSVGLQIADGIFGYLLSLWPMAVMMFATSKFRTPDNRNSLLTLLAETSDPLTILLIGIAAVVVAPIYEELMFRVVLQGWLSTLMKPVVAVPLVAAIFGAIHGLPDGVALLPLALVLGYVFDRRHSYLSVVVIHGLFNATMLTLALLGQG